MEPLDWLQSLEQFFINVSYHILVASLTLMALFLSHQSKTGYKYMISHIDEKLFKGPEPVYGATRMRKRYQIFLCIIKICI